MAYYLPRHILVHCLAGQCGGSRQLAGCARAAPGLLLLLLLLQLLLVQGSGLGRHELEHEDTAVRRAALGGE